MKHLPPAEVAENRRWTMKAWLLLTLPPADIEALMARPMPPTISELIALARTQAEALAGCCANCGAALPVEAPAAPPRARRGNRKHLYGARKRKPLKL